MKLKTLSIAMMSLAAPGLAVADELLEMQKDPNNWVMPAGNYANQRYSQLSQINKDNVKDLNMAWSFSTGVLRGHEGNALIIDGTMYVHTPFPNIVFALDLNNDGAIKWKYEPKQNYDETVPVMCCDTVNRGLSYADGKIFLNQADTTLVALNAEDGKVVWSDKRDDA
ncbi:PQQ-binding-like beta-propeller repeat protein, partial [Methylophaga sp. UBA3991]